MRGYFSSYTRSLLIGAALLIAGLCMGAVYGAYYAAPQGDANCIKQYPLTNHLIDCGDIGESTERMQNVDAAVDAAVALYIKEGKADRISVWTRELDTQQWASTDETERYAPASLLKLPLMIAYYKLAELEPSILDAPLTYQLSPASSTDVQTYPPAVLLTPGQNYSTETLIENMIIYSDNNAADVLAEHMDPAIFENVLVDLGIEIPSPTDGGKSYDFVTAKTYASMFRTLFNASYLDEHYSEKALSLLSQTAFEGIQEPLPSSITVADKFGERGVNNPDGSVQSRELHDCGIVYKPDDPYVLCIMTSGTDSGSLLTIIRDISTLVYQKI